MRSWAATTLVFCTSAAVLVLEILALRLLAPYVGVTLETYTGIIGTVLAAIAVGAALGGRLSDRRDPKPLVGPILVLGGVLAWLSLPLLDGLGPQVGADPLGIVVLTGTAFFLPAAVLSSVAPMAAKLRLEHLGETGRVVGGLSAAGTAGALAGTFLTGFVLVAALPTRPIVLGVGATLVLAGAVVTVRLGRRATTASTTASATVVTAALVLAAGTWGWQATGPCEHETQYFCARVAVDPERPSGRILWLDADRHSYVDLDDPAHLGFRYVRLIASVVDAVGPAGPLDALHLGGGGFTYPRYLAATRPGTHNVVLEIDAELVGLAEAELGLEPGPDLVVAADDARLGIRRLPDDAYDVVVGDAFAGPTVPWHLTTQEMARDVARVLRPGGVYVANVIDGDRDRFTRAQLATLATVFEHVAVILPPAPAVPLGNRILVASDAPLGALDVDPADGRVLGGAAQREYVGSARVLTDDRAPVDQLVARR